VTVVAFILHLWKERSAGIFAAAPRLAAEIPPFDVAMPSPQTIYHSSYHVNM
jgi:hypothetical protein